MDQRLSAPRRFANGLAFVLSCLLACLAGAEPPHIEDERYTIGELLHEEDFADSPERWRPELEEGGAVEVSGGMLHIDVPRGATIWFTEKLEAPVMIVYEVTVVDEGGPNDRVSDLNCFWMATDARNPDDLFAVERSGAFSDYDELICYYVGYGGHTNTRNRFRRYIGEAGDRPLLPEHDFQDEDGFITANERMQVTLTAFSGVAQYFMDGEKLFEYEDGAPLTEGYFAFRTVNNHKRIHSFRVYRLELVDE